MKKKKIRFSNGFSDGSGKGYVVLTDENGEQNYFLAVHWGCSCCDRETTEDDIRLVDKIVKLLNKSGLGLVGDKE